VEDVCVGDEVWDWRCSGENILVGLGIAGNVSDWQLGACVAVLGLENDLTSLFVVREVEGLSPTCLTSLRCPGSSTRRLLRSRELVRRRAVRGGTGKSSRLALSLELNSEVRGLSDCFMRAKIVGGMMMLSLGWWRGVIGR
jgi:hypothetical protein